MNREIKFRVWDIAHNEYLLTERPNNWFSAHSGLVYYDFSEIFERTNRFVLEQFTGLKDKNGKEIYEGDIVLKHVKDGKFIGSPYLVSWQQQSCGFAITWGNNHEYEVVGNIHENKDLIK